MAIFLRFRRVVCVKEDAVSLFKTIAFRVNGSTVEAEGEQPLGGSKVSSNGCREAGHLALGVSANGNCTMSTFPGRHRRRCPTIDVGWNGNEIRDRDIMITLPRTGNIASNRIRSYFLRVIWYASAV
jgi:hypothetical protein